MAPVENAIFRGHDKSARLQSPQALHEWYLQAIGGIDLARLQA